VESPSDAASTHTQDAAEQQALEEEESKKGRGGKKGAKKGNKAKAVLFSWDQKVEIARSELEEVKKDAVETERNSLRMIDTLKVRRRRVCVAVGVGISISVGVGIGVGVGSVARSVSARVPCFQHRYWVSRVGCWVCDAGVRRRRRCRYRGVAVVTAGGAGANGCAHRRA
jgi:hypothetical protein